MAKYYVVTHKDIDENIKKNFTVMFVGAAKPDGSPVPAGMLSDADGDNISAKNGTYCELTAMYEVWKNHLNGDGDDKIGFCHYRRFFTLKSHSVNEKYFLNADTIDAAMGDKRIILPKKIKYLKTVWGMIEDVPFTNEMNVLREALVNASPKYVKDYDEYINGSETYLWNMFVMRKADFTAYCEWMFKVLGEAEILVKERNSVSGKNANSNSTEEGGRAGNSEIGKEQAKTGTTESGSINEESTCVNSHIQESRLYGFLSERLLNIWVAHNMSPDDIAEMRVVHTAEGRFKGYLNSFIRPAKQVLRIIIFRSRSSCRKRA